MSTMTSAHCTHCGSEIGAADEFCRLCGHAQRADGEIFFPVSPTKFVLMNLATFTLYSYYWAYRCWAYAAAISSRRISPFWRATLLPVTAFWLLRHVEAAKTRARRRSGQARPEAGGRSSINVLLALSFLILSAASRLPDPYNIVTVFTFAPLLPALGDINRLNLRQPDHYRRNSRFGILKGAFVLVMLPVVALLSAETVGILSPGGIASDTGLLGWEQQMIHKYTGLAFQSDGNPCQPGGELALNSVFKLPGLTTDRNAPAPHPDTGQLRLAQGQSSALPKGFKRVPDATPAAAPAARTAKPAGTACPSP